MSGLKLREAAVQLTGGLVRFVAKSFNLKFNTAPTSTK